MLISIPAGVGLFVFARPIVMILYPQMATDPVGNELSLSQFEKFFLKQCPYAYGNSVINIYMNSSADNSMIESSLFTIASF